MSMVSNLRTMGLPDLLQWLATTRKTGTLYLKRRSIEKRLLFRDGVIRSSWSNDPAESLGQFLLRDRLITEEQLFKALLLQEDQGGLYGEILISQGLVSEEQLRLALHRKAEETIYDLFLWPDGAFEFRDEDEPPSFFVQIDISVTSVVLEGVRRVDEWRRIRYVIPSLRTTFRVKRTHQRVEDPAELQMLGLVAMGQSLAQISLETRLSEFEAAEILFRLHERALIDVEDPGEDTLPLDTVAAIRDRLGLGDMRLRLRDYAGASRAYQDVLALQPLNQQAKKGLLAVEDARKRDRALQGLDRAMVPVIRSDEASLTTEEFDPQEGFVLSRVNGEWDVASILKVCPMTEEDTLLIVSRLLERGIIELTPATRTDDRPRASRVETVPPAVGD
jgi:hypothetical protein